jgi:3-hydroxyisobutyrate dehydrogenase
VVALHSTLRPDTAPELAAEAAPYGVVVVDAPVTGGLLAAHNGCLAVMVGGPAAAVDRLRPAFGRWAALIVHAGPAGAGTRANLARALVQYVAYAAAGDLAAIVRHSDAALGGPAAVMVRDGAQPLSRADDWYDPLARVRDAGEADLGLALALGRDLGVDLPLADLARDHLAEALGVPR